MDYDSESSFERNGRRKRRSQEKQEDKGRRERSSSRQSAASTAAAAAASNSWRLVNAAAAAAAASATASAGQQAKVPLPANRSLSSQVMEYYQKYSQNANLSQYFSTSSNRAAEGAKYYYSIYELSPTYISSSQNCIGPDYNLPSYLPKERRRWVRPPLIGQSSSTDASSVYVKSMTEPQISPRSDRPQQQQQQQQQQDQQQQYQHHSTTTSTQAIIITEEKSTETSPPHTSPPQTSPCPTSESIAAEHKISSPTSSVASLKPLEWDSGADVGYLYANASEQRLSGGGGGQRRFSTIERMALARGCSAALRLDPEGTTEQQQSPGSIRTTVTAAVLSLTSTRTDAGFGKTPSLLLASRKPEASSTPHGVAGNGSGSESEVEITPIVKNHLPGIIAGHNINADEVLAAAARSRKELLKNANDVVDTPKSANVFKLPQALKYSAEDSKSGSKAPPPSSATASNSSRDVQNEDAATPLKKSSSMNLLASPTAKLPLKRSQSELNLCGNEKAVPRLIYNSTSSIATVVNNKPTTCNKLIQTSMRICAQESVGVQVSVQKDEEKPPLPKRAASLAPRSLNSILKNSKSTYKVQSPKVNSSRNRSNMKEQEQNEKDEDSDSDSSQNASLTPQADDTENVTGRANSFEYFPGHIYENVPNGSTSQVSSVDTGRSNSTMPNTSSSIDEKLWGDSDSLVRDLERSVNILKSLVDANKLDKQVKKRLIHHVVKRLVTAKYTDDKIERNLEENVPWNPADARNKVYRTEIIQALAKNTTDSSDDWKPSQKKKSSKKSAPSNEQRAMKTLISVPAEIESSNSDKFDRNTDRTVMDGRKARMGLRADDCDRRCSSNTPTNKSESSECFLPQRGYSKTDKVKEMYITSTTNSSPQDQNRALLDAVVNSRRSPVESSNEAGHSADWRLPTTMSEHRYQMRRCSNSESGDSKLVSYAEMEKQNQLIWITNEISHLSNLKKLLEQPKTKPERPSKSSPRKTKQSSSKSQKPLPPSHNQNGDIAGEDGELSRQWSSHCNLANCPSPTGISSVRRLKKRNSCTQTGAESSAAYSRTGSEIVSARIHSPNIKLADVSVQTSRIPYPTFTSSVVQVSHDCPVHHNTAPILNCTCSERVCSHCKSKHLSQQQQYRLHTNGDRRDTQTEAKFVYNDSEVVKETKNQLNANKLKCTCILNAKVDQNKKSDRPIKSTTASQTCDQHYCLDPTCSCRRYKASESLCQCSKDCKCENKLVCNFEKIQLSDKAPSKKRLFERTTTAGCACEYKKSEEARSARMECSHHVKNSQPYYLVDFGREKGFHNYCCGNTLKDRAKRTPSPKHSVRTNSSSASECKCCRICGMVYQKDRRCDCDPKNYPKAVAYELSFVDDDKNEERDEDVCSNVNGEIRSIDGNFGASSSRSQEKVTRGTGCACDGSQRPVKRCDCNCKKEQPRKLNSGKKSTLQDYLMSNNPRFADNVETRRQYIAEIQHLRQLRKDRRVQLLSMAATTNIFTSPRPTRVTQHVQKKISDEEMKSRLRKRYLELTEVRAKRKQQQLQKEARCNNLMAKIFGKKLQQKVLKGRVDLSQSASVISNL